MTEKELVDRLTQALPDNCPMEIIAETGGELRARFSSNSIQFQTVENSSHICIQVWQHNNPRIFMVNSFADLDQAISQATEIARDNDADLLLATAAGYKDMDLWDEETASATPADLEQQLVPVLRLSDQANLAVSGRLWVQRRTLAVVNTTGLVASCRATWAGFRALFSTPDGKGTGMAIDSSRSLSGLDSLTASLAATARCQAGINLRPVQPGAYTVIIEPAAAAQLVGMLAGAFSGKAALAGESPFTETGQRYLGSNITIWDDGLDQAGMAMPFDFQGVPKRRLQLVREGVLQNHVWDNRAAGKGLPSTGHATHPTSSRGPLPAHMFMEAGNAMLDDMIVSTKRGILVQRLYKPQVMEPATLLIGGRTGWGTLLVEDGKIAGAVDGLEFVANLVEMFNKVEMVGDEPGMAGTIWSSTTVPALKIRDFELSGS